MKKAQTPLQKPAWKGYAGSLMVEMKQNIATLWTFGLLKLATTLDIASPKTR